MFLRRKEVSVMMQQYYLMNDFISPKKENISQTLEWRLYLKSEFRNSSKK